MKLSRRQPAVPVVWWRGPVAQLGARFHGMEEVVGSNPTRSTKSFQIQLAKCLEAPALVFLSQAHRCASTRVVKTVRRFLLVITVLAVFPGLCSAQGCWQTTKQQVRNDGTTMWRDVRHLPHAMIEPHNLEWEVPVAAATGVLIGTGDTRVANKVKHSPGLNDNSDTASTAVAAAMLGGPGIAYLAGCRGQHSRAVRPELSALTAAGFAFATGEVIKVATFRQRPYVPDSTGKFWDGNTSFPSGHTIAAWAAASSLAHSYPRKRWLRWGAYGAAAAVGVLRITANQHFPSDVVVGGTLGYLIGSGLAHR